MDRDAENRLRAYLRLHERSTQPVFVGREKELGVFDNLVASARDQVAGATMRISGAPGSGKSALLAQFAKAARKPQGRLPGKWAGRRASKPLPAVLTMGLSSFLSRAQFLRDLGAGLGLGGTDTLPVASVETGVGVSGKAGVSAGIEAGVGGRLSERTTFAAVADEPFEGSVAEICHRGAGGRPVIVMLDEAQELADMPDRFETKTILMAMHLGIEDVKIGAVYAGLSNLPDVLRKYGLTRINTAFKWPMPLLEPGETRQFVVETANHLGMTGPVDGLADWAEDNCGRWPQHAVNLMNSVALELLGRDTIHLRDLDVGALRRRVEADRSEYYHGRWEGLRATRQAALAVLDTAQADTRGAGEGALYDIAFELLGDEARADTLIDEMLRKGHLHPVGAGRYKCPIESLERWGRTEEYHAPEIVLERPQGIVR